MTDDPRSHQYNDADWQYEVDSAQRAGTTGQTLERRHGSAHPSKPSDDHESEATENDGGPDEDGIPQWI